MSDRSLFLETDYIEDSDEPIYFPQELMSDDELDDYIDQLFDDFSNFSF